MPRSGRCELALWRFTVNACYDLLQTRRCQKHDSEWNMVSISIHIISRHIDTIFLFIFFMNQSDLTQWQVLPLPPTDPASMQALWWPRVDFGRTPCHVEPIPYLVQLQHEIAKMVTIVAFGCGICCTLAAFCTTLRCNSAPHIAPVVIWRHTVSDPRPVSKATSVSNGELPNIDVFINLTVAHEAMA